MPKTSQITESDEFAESTYGSDSSLQTCLTMLHPVQNTSKGRFSTSCNKVSDCIAVVHLSVKHNTCSDIFHRFSL